MSMRQDSLEGCYRDLKFIVKKLEARVSELEKKLERLSEPEDLKEEKFVRDHGELVTRIEAGKIIGVSRQTISKMLWDGRLKGTVDNSRVSVRSIYRYLHSFEEEKV